MHIPREKIVLSLDDFGISRKANGNILSLLPSVRVDRISVMVNGQSSGEEINRLKASGAKLDIHLDFKDSLVKKRKLEEGVARRACAFSMKYLFGNCNPGLMEIEWDRQIKKFQELFGQNPDGISSHQNIHFFPPYFKLVLKLSRENNIPYLRFGEKAILGDKTGICKILRWLKSKNNRAFFHSHCLSSDYLVGFNWIKNFGAFINKLPDGKTELVCHPEIEREKEIIIKYFGN